VNWEKIIRTQWKGDIAKAEDEKSLKKALVMVAEVVKKRNVNTHICYCRYKVCFKYGHVEKTFARNQLLYDEHLTAGVLGIDVKYRRISEQNEYHQGHCPPRQAGINIICICKKGDSATSANCIRRKNGKLCTSKCHGGRGGNTLCTCAKVKHNYICTMGNIAIVCAL